MMSQSSARGACLHVLRHPGIHHHREVPIDGISEPREPADRREREANHFAGCFLVPRKLLQFAFRAAFGVESLRLTDDVAFELLGGSFAALMSSPYDSIGFERVVAQDKIEARRRFYNEARPHGTLDWRAPIEFARQIGLKPDLATNQEPEILTSER